jgi:hypothetical protein
VAWDSLRPKKPEWFRASAIVCAVSLASYGGLAWWFGWAPGRFGGLVAGTLAAAIYAVDGAYPLRRRLLGWPFGTAQRWLQFHIYGGFVACIFVFVHMGFRWPGGQFGWWLFALTVWTTVSGLVGVWLQKWIPMLIVSNLSVEALYDRIPELIDRLQAEADRVVAGSSEMLERAYQADIRPQLAGVNPSWAHLFDIRSRREQRMQPLQHVAQFLDEGERERLADLKAIFTEKTELDVQYSLQRMLRQWAMLHVPPSMLLLALLIVHILSVVYF